MHLPLLLKNNVLMEATGGWTWPSWQLVGAVLGLDILATIFALFGWLSGPAPHNGFALFISPLVTYLHDATPW